MDLSTSCDLKEKKNLQHRRNEIYIHHVLQGFLWFDLGKLKRQKLFTQVRGPFPAPSATQAFSQSGNMKMHKRSQTREKQFVCNQWDMIFYFLGNLKRHRRQEVCKAIAVFLRLVRQDPIFIKCFEHTQALPHRKKSLCLLPVQPDLLWLKQSKET